MKISIWDDNKTKAEIAKRWTNAQESRKYDEERWARCERAIYSTTSGSNVSYLQNDLNSSFNVGVPSVDGSSADMNVAAAFTNFRFIHAQMSSNPPSVVMRPTSSDQEDKRKADAADRITRYAGRQYNMQENIDQLSLNALLYGTGVIKTVWDSNLGAILSYDKQTGELQLEGDISVSTPFMWNLFLDPDAKSIDQIKWAIERIYPDYDEACLRWPDKAEVLKKALVTKDTTPAKDGRETSLQNDRYNCVELLEYWETGLPTNGYLGRYCVTLTDGTVIEKCRPSPHRFRMAGAVYAIEMDEKLSDEEKEAKIDRLPEQASLPYHILTDIDVPNRVWGRSAVEYAAQLQDNLGRFDTARLDNIEAHGTARLIVPESAEIADDGLSNSPWDVTKIAGNQPPYYMSAPQLMPDMTPMRQDIINGIDKVMGVNESMAGMQSREQSAASMQYAVNQGNMIRRRLFNKYVLVVESIYKSILNLVRKHWTTTRTINVLGKEKALEAIDIKGADIDGGYDVVGEYGTSLSLDPITRKQEIMTLQPMFKEAGVPPRTSLRMMKLSELEGLYDKLDMAGARQKEIFDAMIATNSYIPPKPFRDHENMIAWAFDYFMTSEFNSLSDEQQLLCERHIEERGVVAAQQAGAPAEQAQPGQAPGPLPSGGGAEAAAAIPAAEQQVPVPGVG
jgi:hypothetical protein